MHKIKCGECKNECSEGATYYEIDDVMRCVSCWAKRAVQGERMAKRFDRMIEVMLLSMRR